MTLDESNSRDADGHEAVDGRSVRLTWTDPETEDLIAVDVHGSEAFLRGLLELGFELGPAHGPVHDPEGGAPRGSARARSSTSRAPATRASAARGERGRADDAA